MPATSVVINPGTGGPEPQAGLLTAGDYDDVLNPDLYKAYLDKTLQGDLGRKGLPFVMPGSRIAVRVVDRLGKPVPLADVDLQHAAANGDKTFATLQTGADGVAYIYPGLDGLSGGADVVTVSAGGKSKRLKTTQTLEQDGGELVFDLPIDRAVPSKLDLLLTIDATGSMADEMRYLQAELEGILDRVKSANPGISIHVGLIVYRDVGDEYVIRDFPFTDDIDALKKDLGAQRATGGGDMPEAMRTALQRAMDFQWRGDAIKVNLLVADAPPHDAEIKATWDAALAARQKGIHMVPLAASGVDETAEFLMRAMGQLTGGRYLFLTDDSGIGNPHAEPTVDCYVVTRLDTLVTRVLLSLIKGERVEPEGSDVIRTVGNYRGGVCKVEMSEQNEKPAQSE